MFLKSGVLGRRRAKVLFLHNEASNSGSTRLLLDFLKFLQVQKPEFSPVLCLYRAGALLGEFKSLGFPVFVFDPETDANSQKKSKFERMLGLIWFSTMLMRIRPVLLYSNTVMSSTSVLVAGCVGIRTLVHVHEGPRFLDRTGAKLRLSTMVTDRFVTVSEYCASGIRDVLQRPADVVRNWTSIEKAQGPGKSATLESPVVIGMVGTIDRNKHHLLALMAIASLKGRCAKPVRIRIIGPAADIEYARELEHTAVLLGVSDFVTFAGTIANPEEIYRGLDVVLVASMEETFSLVALEAACLGKTIVAANVGGIREAIPADARAIFFRAGDWRSLADALGSALDEHGMVRSREKSVAASDVGATATSPHAGPKRLLELIRLELAA